MRRCAGRRGTDPLSYDRDVGGRISIVGLTSVFVLGLGVALAGSAGCSSIPDITFDDADAGGSNTCDSNRSCVERVPSDWQVVAFAEGARPPCPSGFGGGADVRSVQGASGPPKCTCNCSGSSSCADGKVTLALGTDASCGGSTESLDVENDCERLNGTRDFEVGANAFLRATPPPTPSCNGTSSSSPPPLRDSRICKLEASSAGGCGASSICAPRTGNGYQLCIQKAGANACPSGFSSEHRAGTGAADTRSCSACTCTASPCSVEVKLHDSTNCGSPKVTLTTTGTCTQVSTAAFSARGYETKVSGGCGAAGPSQGSGNLSIENESTVCCRSGN